MPYISPQRRMMLDHFYELREDPQNAGELNFMITDLLLRYLSRGDSSYGDFNEVIGALECAKLEMYRRAIVPYEDKKIEENGDVYI